MKKAQLLAASALALIVSEAQSHANETKTYTYDALGRLVVAKSTGTVNNNQTRSICYDPAGNRTKYKSGGNASEPNCIDGTLPSPSPSPTPTPTPTPSPIQLTDGSLNVLSTHQSTYSCVWDYSGQAYGIITAACALDSNGYVVYLRITQGTFTDEYFDPGYYSVGSTLYVSSQYYGTGDP